MLSDTEKPPTPTDDRQPGSSRITSKRQRHLAPRRRKETLLPQIRDLALEGHNSREIAARLGVGKTTIHRWLQELREESLGNVADAGEMIANAAARYDSIYREAMEAWRNSKGDKQVRLVEETETDGEGGGWKRKKSIRSEQRAGEIAFLAKAKEALDARCKLVPREALRQGKAASPPLDLESLESDDLRNMTNEDLLAIEAEIEAKIAAEERAAEASKPKQNEGNTDKH